MTPNTVYVGTATYGRRRPVWHDLVPTHPADCGCRRPATDPWPTAPVVPPRHRIGGVR